MNVTGLPTSSDIYLEVEGRKVAVVQSYQAKSQKSSRSVEAFGEAEPIATIPGQTKHTIVLKRLYATDSAIADGINFYELRNFHLVIAKPGKRIIYTDCQWAEIGESGSLGDTVVEQVSIVATKRLETSA